MMIWISSESTELSSDSMQHHSKQWHTILRPAFEQAMLRLVIARHLDCHTGSWQDPGQHHRRCYDYLLNTHFTTYIFYITFF